MKRQKTVDAYTCDCCGAEIDDKARAYITVSFNGEVWYEWWQRLQEIVTGEVDFANPQETYRAIADLIDRPSENIERPR